jgi:hypothetical protein
VTNLHERLAQTNASVRYESGSWLVAMTLAVLPPLVVLMALAARFLVDGWTVAQVAKLDFGIGIAGLGVLAIPFNIRKFKPKGYAPGSLPRTAMPSDHP